MKRFFVNMITAFAVLFVSGGCSEVSLEVPKPVDSGEGLITLYLMNGETPTRAASDILDYEKAVSHIDVIIFANGTDGNPAAKVFHARKDAANLEGQKIVLGKRSEFQNEYYWIYVIANHVNDDGTDSTAEFEEISDFKEFCGMSSSHERVFLTGHEDLWSSAVSIPKYFLMDGVAYDSAKETEYKANGATTVNLNDATVDASMDLALKVDLKRAAAKIKINIIENPKSGTYDDYVEFNGQGGNSSLPDGSTSTNLALDGFYLRNMPYSTSLIGDARYKAADVRHELKLRNTVKYNGPRFKYVYGTQSTTDIEKIEITAYAYARDWSNANPIDKTTVVANIPLIYHECTGVDAEGKALEGLNIDTDGDGTYDAKWIWENLPQNYYQIPISQTKKLERNGYYEVTVAISIPGGSDPSEPVKLEPISYGVYPWTQETINIGNSTERPVYLALNKEEFEMYNMTTDSNTLEFASSSELKSVSASSISVYYYNKLGVKTTVNSSTHGVTVTPDAGMSGNITVYSPLPTNNTIRYIEFEVENQDGLKKKITVRQYPLVYITNTQSWYSYRSDFIGSNASVPTTYQNRSTTNNVVGITRTGGHVTSISTSWGSYSGSAYWVSKVVTTENDNGSSTISLYSRNNTYSVETSANSRMYHVRITASSKDYILGAPRMTDPDSEGLSYTDPGVDNKKMVSPAFMIASRLGFFYSSNVDLDPTSNSNALDVVRKHCANYVEVYKDASGNPVHLYDWRLPTEEELKIIMNIQGKKGESAASIDYLLNANFYYSASGPVFNTKNDDNNSVGDYESTSVRCIRDAFTTVPDQTQIPGFSK